MPNQKISELTELAAGNVANDDEVAIVDTSTTSTKRWTWASIKSDILSWLGFTATEASYLSGVTSAIQTQIDGKADSSHTHTLTDITDSGALAALDTVGTAEIDNDAVTFDKIANIATNRVLARSSAGSGSVEALTLPNFRTLINVEDGADVTDTTNVTAAGALMDSEVTDLAGIKSLDTSTLQVKPAEGAFVDGDKTKLDGIETGATADQTGAEIKALYEAEANTNAFTDAEQSKLSGIESGADVTDETNVVSALSGATLSDAGTPQATDKVLVQDSSDSDNLKYVDFSDFSSGTTVDVVSNVAADRILGRVTAGSGDSEELTATQVRTLINVEDGATADQTGAEIKALYEAEADTNAFTDADHSKLDGIEAGADVTDATNVDAAGAVMNSDASTAAMSFVVDEDNMISNSATKVPTQQSTKAYVDAGLAGKQDTITNSDDITEGSSNLFMTTSERSKLSAIEANADVTDTANVTAAGALMDSEVDADIKTLSLPANTTISTFGATLVDDADAGTARTTLGLGTIATLSAPSGTVVGTTDTQTLTNKTIAYGSNTISGLPVEIGIACSDESTALTTGTAKVTFRMPFAMTLTDVRASLTGAGSTSGTTTIDINESGTSILSTKLTIDNTEKTSETAATAAVISDSALADDAEITIDIDAVTGGADETGLKVWLIGTRA